MVDLRVLTLGGDIDISRRSWLKHELDKLELSSRASATIIDLTDVGFADSTLLNALIPTKERAEHERCDGPICIIARNYILRLFELAMLEDVFPIFHDVTSARLYLLTEGRAHRSSIRQWQARVDLATETATALRSLLEDIERRTRSARDERAWHSQTARPQGA